ncbi:hypothetical protein L3556_02415 [Candidatus Synechococcus calcipolaris G9]|uniref:tRNA nuclease CdiA C-terminal domain-containing protein n=1 Tax=Candidatus Synechococcus calcipolaris G9 TaxID=1497997 RepID=A0ABT6EY21_9SYNE|nr:hypothetical protein [Candidatus Synechococcus calcipolaris]MDG2989795.1 hypothetical protein [Candidatus Synechococcus calcipolaris G9]
MYPPCGWGCQCSVVTLSERDLEHMGKDEPDNPPMIGGVIDVVDPKTGKGTVAKVEAGAGDYVPGESNVKERRRQIIQRLDPQLQQRIIAEVQGHAPGTAVNPIAQKRFAYEAAGSEYEKHYFDEQTGGYVLIHEGHNRSASFESEVFVAETFARQGYRVELVDEEGEDGQRRFDALVDGESWEFKELTAKAKNIRGAFQRGLVHGRSQAPRIAYHVNRQVDVQDLNIGLDRAIHIDKKTQRILKVALIYGDGRIQVLEREEIDAGQKF